VVTSGDGLRALEAATEAAGGHLDAVAGVWRDRVRQGVWSGRCTLEDAAEELADASGADRDELARVWDETMRREVQVLAEVVGPLAGLSAQVPLWVLSNHRDEWLDAPRREIGWMVDRWFVSGCTGAVKPDQAAFEGVEAAWAARCELDGVAGAAPRFVYVDDQQTNLRAADARGWHTVDGSEPRWWLEVQRLVDGPG